MTGSPCSPPLVSFIVLCYRQAEVVHRAVKGALAQDYGPLEIVISDDASPDDTFARVRALLEGYDGPHRIVLNRNPVNLGIAPHLDRAVALSSGEFIVVNAGDDRSLPHRTRRLVDAWLASNRAAHAVHSDCHMLGEDGQALEVARPPAAMRGDPGPDAIARRYLHTIGATLGWSREVYDRFGPLHGEALIEDHVIPFRAALIGKVAYLDEPLVMKYPGGVANLALARTARDKFFGPRLRDLDWICGDYRQFARDLDRAERADAPALREVVDAYLEASLLEREMARARPLRRIGLAAISLRRGLRGANRRYLRSAFAYGLAPLSLWLYDRLWLERAMRARTRAEGQPLPDARAADEETLHP